MYRERKIGLLIVGIHAAHRSEGEFVQWSMKIIEGACAAGSRFSRVAG